MLCICGYDIKKVTVRTVTFFYSKCFLQHPLVIRVTKKIISNIAAAAIMTASADNNAPENTAPRINPMVNSISDARNARAMLYSRQHLFLHSQWLFSGSFIGQYIHSPPLYVHQKRPSIIYYVKYIKVLMSAKYNNY